MMVQLWSAAPNARMPSVPAGLPEAVTDSALEEEWVMMYPGSNSTKGIEIYPGYESTQVWVAPKWGLGA